MCPSPASQRGVGAWGWHWGMVRGMIESGLYIVSPPAGTGGGAAAQSRLGWEWPQEPAQSRGAAGAEATRTPCLQKCPPCEWLPGEVWR